MRNRTYGRRSSGRKKFKVTQWLLLGSFGFLYCMFLLRPMQHMFPAAHDEENDPLNIDNGISGVERVSSEWSGGDGKAVGHEGRLSLKEWSLEEEARNEDWLSVDPDTVQEDQEEGQQEAGGEEQGSRSEENVSESPGWSAEQEEGQQEWGAMEEQEAAESQQGDDQEQGQQGRGEGLDVGEWEGGDGGGGGAGEGEVSESPTMQWSSSLSPSSLSPSWVSISPGWSEGESGPDRSSTPTQADQQEEKQQEEQQQHEDQQQEEQQEKEQQLEEQQQEEQQEKEQQQQEEQQQEEQQEKEQQQQEEQQQEEQQEKEQQQQEEQQQEEQQEKEQQHEDQQHEEQHHEDQQHEDQQQEEQHQEDQHQEDQHQEDQHQEDDHQEDQQQEDQQHEDQQQQEDQQQHEDQHQEDDHQEVQQQEAQQQQEEQQQQEDQHQEDEHQEDEHQEDEQQEDEQQEAQQQQDEQQEEQRQEEQQQQEEQRQEGENGRLAMLAPTTQSEDKEPQTRDNNENEPNLKTELWSAEVSGREDALGDVRQNESESNERTLDVAEDESVGTDVDNVADIDRVVEASSASPTVKDTEHIPDKEPSSEEASADREALAKQGHRAKGFWGLWGSKRSDNDASSRATSTSSPPALPVPVEVSGDLNAEFERSWGVVSGESPSSVLGTQTESLDAEAQGESKENEDDHSSENPHEDSKLRAEDASIVNEDLRKTSEDVRNGRRDDNGLDDQSSEGGVEPDRVEWEEVADVEELKKSEHLEALRQDGKQSEGQVKQQGDEEINAVGLGDGDADAGLRKDGSSSEDGTLDAGAVKDSIVESAGVASDPEERLGGHTGGEGMMDGDGAGANQLTIWDKAADADQLAQEESSISQLNNYEAERLSAVFLAKNAGTRPGSSSPDTAMGQEEEEDLILDMFTSTAKPPPPRQEKINDEHWAQSAHQFDLAVSELQAQAQKSRRHIAPPPLDLDTLEDAAEEDDIVAAELYRISRKKEIGPKPKKGDKSSTINIQPLTNPLNVFADHVVQPDVQLEVEPEDKRDGDTDKEEEMDEEQEEEEEEEEEPVVVDDYAEDDVEEMWDPVLRERVALRLGQRSEQLSSEKDMELANDARQEFGLFDQEEPATTKTPPANSSYWSEGNEMDEWERSRLEDLNSTLLSPEELSRRSAEQQHNEEVLGVDCDSQAGQVNTNEVEGVDLMDVLIDTLHRKAACLRKQVGVLGKYKAEFELERRKKKISEDLKREADADLKWFEDWTRGRVPPPPPPDPDVLEEMAAEAERQAQQVQAQRLQELQLQKANTPGGYLTVGTLPQENFGSLSGASAQQLTPEQILAKQDQDRLLALRAELDPALVGVLSLAPKRWCKRYTDGRGRMMEEEEILNEHLQEDHQHEEDEVDEEEAEDVDEVHDNKDGIDDQKDEITAADGNEKDSEPASETISKGMNTRRSILEESLQVDEDRTEDDLEAELDEERRESLRSLEKGAEELLKLAEEGEVEGEGNVWQLENDWGALAEDIGQGNLDSGTQKDEASGEWLEVEEEEEGSLSNISKTNISTIDIELGEKSTKPPDTEDYYYVECEADELSEEEVLTRNRLARERAHREAARAKKAKYLKLVARKERQELMKQVMEQEKHLASVLHQPDEKEKLRAQEREWKRKEREEEKKRIWQKNVERVMRQASKKSIIISRDGAV